ncbi:hypothetical protein [Patulibacter americanus]|nr:hypothetical protein [Patulibacter americanus]
MLPPEDDGTADDLTVREKAVVSVAGYLVGFALGGVITGGLYLLATLIL